ncbi:MAG: tyrosine-protein phosphatase [Bacteriovorax sp.]|nr:tyrosine-protein phosphatase [Bacteriovorax sp.]
MKKLLTTLTLIIASISNNLFAASTKPITNFSKVNEAIYRGARLTSIEAAQYLTTFKVKTIINLQGGDLDSDIGIIIPWAEPGERPENIAKEKANAISLGMRFFHAPLNSLEPITNLEDSLIDQILDFMHDPTNQPVFIHCEHGADRTGLLVALYRVKYEGMSIEAARAEWIKNGHNKLHQIFTGDLDDYFFSKVKQFGMN